MNRVNNVNKPAELPSEVQLGKLKYQPNNNKLFLPSGEVKLTTKENELLKLLVESIDSTVNRSVALKKIWKDDSYFNARSMDVYIAKLRKFLKEDDSIQLLTVHGEGFKLVRLN